MVQKRNIYMPRAEKGKIQFFSHRISLVVSAHTRKHGTLRIVPVGTVQSPVAIYQREEKKRRKKTLGRYIILFTPRIPNTKKIVDIGL